MAIIRMWSASTKEGMFYLKCNGYKPFCRLNNDLWLVNRIGDYLPDVQIVEN